MSRDNLKECFWLEWSVESNPDVTYPFCRLASLLKRDKELPFECVSNSNLKRLCTNPEFMMDCPLAICFDEEE